MQNHLRKTRNETCCTQRTLPSRSLTLLHNSRASASAIITSDADKTASARTDFSSSYFHLRVLLWRDHTMSIFVRELIGLASRVGSASRIFFPRKRRVQEGCLLSRNYRAGGEFDFLIISHYPAANDNFLRSGDNLLRFRCTATPFMCWLRRRARLQDGQVLLVLY